MASCISYGRERMPFSGGVLIVEVPSRGITSVVGGGGLLAAFGSFS
jgi:hypothetical protein